MDETKDEMEKILEAKWCIDSETGIEYLINLKTGKVLLVRGAENG